jgi:hypothetical protein
MRQDEGKNAIIILLLCRLKIDDSPPGECRLSLEVIRHGSCSISDRGVAQVPAAQALLGFSLSPSGFGAPVCYLSPLGVARLASSMPLAIPYRGHEP